ncbi:MAG: hypothetical protein HY900_19620 [Deltaproteobacteria bacterium]|nr:hypothetical protein [Deltaproteobacteria bacterium]
MKQIRKGLSACAVALLLAACGGGGGGGGGDGTRTAELTFSVDSAGTLSAPVQGVVVSAVLPAGATVATDPGTTSISAAALAAGKDLTSPDKMVSGTFSAVDRKVQVAVATPEETFLGGNVATVTVTCPPATTAADFTLGPSESFQAAGYDPVRQTIVDLATRITPSLTVTFR